MALAFEWDSRKAAENESKHGVGFKEASTVFGDPLGWFQTDEAHSAEEERLLLLGRSSENRLLAVLFTDRGDELIRMISARLATPRERRKYEKDFR
ncbi:MAG: BrnT family toxin [Gemmatimonadaceae bacterium]